MLLEREGAEADEEFERIQKNWPRDHHKKWVKIDHVIMNFFHNTFTRRWQRGSDGPLRQDPGPEGVLQRTAREEERADRHAGGRDPRGGQAVQAAHRAVPREHRSHVQSNGVSGQLLCITTSYETLPALSIFTALTGRYRILCKILISVNGLCENIPRDRENKKDSLIKNYDWLAACLESEIESY